ncbi:MAG: DUF3499 family protein [Nitriliruptorales bacterium]|nr:DUF3499 family protein [Nitriliruptorales bacterium]
MEPARDAVVRSIARASARPCARPGCPAPASATLSFRYSSREAWLGELRAEAVPETYDLCGTHADRTRPPHGWQLVDRRPVDTDEPGSEGFGDERTVAVLKAALRGDAADPSPPLEAAPPSAAPARSDDDLTEVLSALVRELDAQVEVEASSVDEADAGEPSPPTADAGGDEVAVLLEAVDALQTDLGAETELPSEAAAGSQDRLPFDRPTVARDW